MNNPKIRIIISTIREGRFGDKPARWIFDIASGREGLDFEIVDLRDYPLSHLREHPPTGHETSRWSGKLDGLDGNLFVTAEYNHSMPGVLKNALDHVSPECHRKPAAFVGYGGVGGARAVEQLRLVCIELQMAPTRTGVHIGMGPLLGVRKEGKSLSDYDFLTSSADTMLDELAWWTFTLKAGREEAIEYIGAEL